MPGTGNKSALAVAERIRDNMEKVPMDLGAASYTATVSIGVAIWDGKETPEQLEARADEAMCEIKSEGRNGVRFREVLPEPTSASSSEESKKP